VRSLRIVVVVLAGTLAVSSCRAGSTVDTTAPKLTPETAAELTAIAIARACGNDCTSLSVYVYDKLRTANTTLGAEQPMPESTRLAIADQFDGVQFVDRAQQDTLIDQHSLGPVDGGNGVLISVGPVEDLAPGVVGIEVAVVRGRLDAVGQTVQFQWTNDGWVPATSDDTGVTTTSWVS